jgi:hypothetical protein
MNERARLTEIEVAESRSRRLAAMRLQEIEGNPLGAEQVAMFEREGWSFERRREHLLRRVRGRVAAE